jgi:hypothetical protein
MTHDSKSSIAAIYFCRVEYRIAIKPEGPTDISALKNRNAVIKSVALTGKGKLGACMFTFGKNGGSVNEQKDLLFIKPLHERTELLLPHIKGFAVSDYDYCSVQVFTGTPAPGDEIKLTVVCEDKVRVQKGTDGLDMRV